jgi:hypothetical protein
MEAAGVTRKGQGKLHPIAFYFNTRMSHVVFLLGEEDVLQVCTGVTAFDKRATRTPFCAAFQPPKFMQLSIMLCSSRRFVTPSDRAARRCRCGKATTLDLAGQPRIY